MKKFVTFSVVLAVALGACESQRSASQKSETEESSQALHVGDNSQVSLDWEGTYFGVLPCADCPGISTVVILNQDGQYKLETKYLDRDIEVITEEGEFTWDPTGSYVTLEASDNRKFQVGENRLFHLDLDGNRIEGMLADHYILKKAGNDIRDIYWKLIEINGQSIEGVKTMKEPYLRLNSEENRAEASGGCNGMGGTYELKDDNWRLSFSQFMSTQMACENMEIEQQLADVIQRTDSYAVANDTLQLIRARMAPLAKFKAVYINAKVN